MNADRFNFYIKNPAHLYQITYTELKSLVLQYPYCQNLRYLLLKKSILEKHSESNKNLQLAATYSNDRNFLYQQINDKDAYESEVDSFRLKEAYLELKDLQSEQVIEEYSASDSVENVIIIDSANTELEAFKTDNKSIINIAPSEAKSIEQNKETDAQETNLSFNLEEIAEDEIIDITDEIDSVFVDENLDKKEIQDSQTVLKEEESEQGISNENIVDEDKVGKVISIEELIEMDNSAPLERLELIKSHKKEIKRKDEHKIEDDTNDMKRKDTDFEEIDALIKRAKKKVPFEITNKDSLNVTEDTSPRPSPKSSFGSWLKQFKASEEEKPKEEIFDLPEVKKEKPSAKKEKKKKKLVEKSKKPAKSQKKKTKRKKEKKKGKAPTIPPAVVPEKAKIVAEKSLIQNSEIVSETLANLLVKQEKYKKAIKMYENLSLIFPEKSAYFAEQIKKLKKL